MPEPFALIDEWELLIYGIVYEQLQRQKLAVASAEFFSPTFFDKEYEIMARALAPVVGEIMLAGVLNSTPEPLLANLADLFENERLYAEQHAGKLIKQINGTTLDEVQKVVNELTQQSIVEGWDIDTFTGNILEELNESIWFSEMRARRIAVTETTNAYMGGAELSMNELRGQGLNIRLRWLTANDDRVCAICAPRHLKLQGEGWTEPKAAHVGCRCNLAQEEFIL